MIENKDEVYRAFEEDFAVSITEEPYWGSQDYFFVHDTYAYYYKPYILERIHGDIKALVREQVNPARKELLTVMREVIPGWAGSPCGQQSMAQVNRVIGASPIGMPTFVAETKHFYQFESFGTYEIGIENIDNAMLDKISQSFGSTFGPYYNDMGTGLYLHNDKVYWAYINQWAHYNQQRPMPYKAGMFIQPPTSTTRYSADNVYFFPHMEMSDLLVEQVKLMGKWEYGNTNLVIVNL